MDNSICLPVCLLIKLLIGLLMKPPVKRLMGLLAI
jgi:hypothetical protein